MTVGDAAAIERWYSPDLVPAGNAADAAPSGSSTR
jgi:hypothetical protein